MQPDTVQMVDRYGIIVITVIVIGCLIWIVQHVFMVALPNMMTTFDKQLGKTLDLFDRQINMERSICQKQHSMVMERLELLMQRIQILDDSGDRLHQTTRHAVVAVHQLIVALRTELGQDLTEEDLINGQQPPIGDNADR